MSRSPNFVLFAFIIFVFVLCQWQVVTEKTYYDPRIVGGVPANIEKSKFVVSVRLVSDDGIFGKGHICGGTLISRKLVLTAAHCLINYNNAPVAFRGSYEFAVVMGTLNRFVNVTDSLKIKVAQALYHRHFSLVTMQNDIAILVLLEEVPANHPTIAPIPTAQLQVTPGTICEIFGWGSMSYGQPGTEELRMAAIEIVSRNICEVGHNSNLRPGMICAGNEYKDSCQGDSGGPLKCNGSLYGIVSWGEKCATPGYPGIYTDIYFYKEWLKQEFAEIQDENTSIQDKLHVASIRLKEQEKEGFGQGHICSGSLISSMKSLAIVTTAHCLVKNNGEYLDARELIVVLGTANRVQKNENTLQFNVGNIKIHEKFDLTDISHDIALLRLEGFLPENHTTVRPIELIDFEIKDNLQCVTHGWGNSIPAHNRPIEHIRTNTLTVIDSTKCNGIYGGDQIKKDLLCAGDLFQLQDPIKTDDGGPLSCDGKLSGLMIQRMDIARPGYPSIYSNIFYYKEWIMEATGGFASHFQPSGEIIAFLLFLKFIS